MTDPKNKDLEKKLQEVTKEKSQKNETQQAQDEKSPLEAGTKRDQAEPSNELLKKITELEKENKELDETCKRAQYDYINLKSDMDIYQRRMQEKESNMKIDTLIETIKKFLPFVEELRKSMENISDDHKEDPLSKGLQLTYDKFLKKLEEMGIKSIEAIGLNPDSELHEPVSMMPTEDKKMKGKIVQEFERGFVYEKDGQKKIISPAKVVIGQ